MRPVLDDFRFSFRLLRKQPGFALLATACLALGIGANSSIFSLLNALLLRTLPVEDAQRLVVLERGKTSHFSFPEYKELARRFQNSGSMLATVPTESSLDRAGYAGQLVTAEAVSGNYAGVLRVGTTLGEWFDNEDAPVAVISFRAWQEFFHGDPRALGQQVRSETQPYTVVGVAPKDFRGLSAPTSTSVWVPLRIWTRQHPSLQARLNDRDSPLVMIFARLAGGMRYSEATAHLRLVETQWNRETIHGQRSHDAITAELARGVSGSGDRASVEKTVALLFAAVGTLLLICCVNVGNLLLVRGASRQKEIAIRYSLGATRGRIIRQLLADSFLLAAMGGTGGLLLNLLLVRLIVWLVPALPLGENISLDVPLDGRVIGFVAGSALGSVFLFGLLPAWKASVPNLAAKIRGSWGAVRSVTLRRSSAIAQVALSFVLLFVAGLFLDTCWQLGRADPGFAVRNRLYATTYISKPEFTAQQIPGFYQQVLASVSAAPNVRSAGLTYLLPLGAVSSECVKSSGSDQVAVSSSVISPGFLRAIEIRLLHGRDFDHSDRADTQAVVLINHTLAIKLWPNTSAVGRHIQLGCREGSEASVVGVVSDSKTVSLSEGFQPHVYRVFSQNATGLANIVIETSGPMATAATQLREALLKQGHGMRVYAVNQLSQHVEQSYWQLRWEAWLLGAFGAAALLLAALGLYGLTAYSTALRAKEFGLRMALGAQPTDIQWLVLKEGFVMGMAGICLGSIAAIAVSGVLRHSVLRATESASLACVGAGLLWLIVMAVAAYIPARYWSRVEPSTILHYD